MVRELGTHKSDSYSSFCEACEAVDRLYLVTHCFAMDTWEGEQHSGKYGEEFYQELAAYHDSKYGYFSVPLKWTFDNAVDQFGDACIDLLHIDGFHTYDAVRHDLVTWTPKLSADALVLFHDITVHEKDFGGDASGPTFPNNTRISILSTVPPVGAFHCRQCQHCKPCQSNAGKIIRDGFREGVDGTEDWELVPLFTRNLAAPQIRHWWAIDSVSDRL
jgi:hypothetical protein